MHTDGYFHDWDAMGKFWNWSFYNELRVEPEKHGVLLAENVNNPDSYRDYMC